MPIPVSCSGCNTKFRAPDKVAGKRIKCPKCGGVIAVPAAGGAKKKQAAAPAKPQLSDEWHVQIAGEVYGPVTKAELDEWVEENRLDHEDKVRQEGTDKWQSTVELYPQLNPAGPAAANNPFGFLGGQPKSDPSQEEAPAAPEPTPEPATPAETQPAQQTPNTVATPAETSVPAAPPKEVPPKKKQLAGLLGVFLGYFGVHRFYLGYKMMGTIQILVTICTCCIGGWWGIIEGLFILTGKIDQDALGRQLIDE